MRMFVVFGAVLAAGALAGCTGDGAELPVGNGDAPYPVAADTPRYEGPELTVDGLFTEPRETTIAAVRSLGPQPQSPFPPWDGESVVLYDLESGEATNLGPGGLQPGPAVFSPDSTRLVWRVDSLAPTDGSGEIRVIDLATMEDRPYGEAWFAHFEDDQTLQLISADSGFATTFVDLDSGATVERDEIDPFRIHMPGGYILEHPSLLLPAEDQRYRIVPDDGSEARVFEALFATPLDPDGDELIVVTMPVDGTANVFRLPIDDASARFIATVRVAAALPFLGGISVEGAEVLAIGDGACSPDGRTLLYDLAGGTLTAIDRPLRLTLVPRPGQLAVDGFGTVAGAIIDLDTMEYVHVLPAPGRWSADGRWAAVGPSIAPVDLCSLELGG